MISKFFNWLFPKHEPLQVHKTKQFVADFSPSQDGHRIFEYDPNSDTYKEVQIVGKKEYANKTIYEINCTEGFLYVSALNKKNAKKYIDKQLNKKS